MLCIGLAFSHISKLMEMFEYFGNIQSNSMSLEVMLEIVLLAGGCVSILDQVYRFCF